MGDAEPVTIWPVEAVTLYPVIGDPPLLAGGKNETVACPFPAEADTAVGAPGTALGVTTLEGADGGLNPRAFLALTVNEYGVPFVRPVTTIGDVVPVAGMPPGEEVAV
jgi:hypothetical protein